MKKILCCCVVFVMFGAVIAQNAAAMGASDGYSKASREFTNIADASWGAAYYY